MADTSNNRSRRKTFSDWLSLLFPIAIGLWLIISIIMKKEPLSLLRLAFYESIALSFLFVFERLKKWESFCLAAALLATSCAIVFYLIENKDIAFRFIGLLGLALFIPMLVLLFVTWLPIKESFKKCFFLSVIPIVILMITGRWGNAIQTTSTIISAIPLFWVAIKNEDKRTRLTDFVIFTVIFLVINQLFGHPAYTIFPSAFFLVCMVILLLFSFLDAKEKTKNVLVLVVALFSIPISMIGAINSFVFFSTKMTEHHQEQKNKTPFRFEYIMKDKAGNVITSDDLLGKNVAIMFWSERCASCHKEMPYFSDLAFEYESDTSKCFIAAFIAFDESDTTFYIKECQQEFAFTWAKVIGSEKVMHDLEFNTFPHMTIVNKEGNVVYNGAVNNRPWIFVYNPRKYLDL